MKKQRFDPNFALNNRQKHHRPSEKYKLEHFSEQYKSIGKNLTSYKCEKNPNKTEIHDLPLFDRAIPYNEQRDIFIHERVPTDSRIFCKTPVEIEINFGAAMRLESAFYAVWSFHRMCVCVFHQSFPLPFVSTNSRICSIECSFGLFGRVLLWFVNSLCFRIGLMKMVGFLCYISSGKSFFRPRTEIYLPRKF